MENFLKKIFSRHFDNTVHEELIKFGRGMFQNKYLVEAKKQKSLWGIKTGAEFANFLVKKCLEEVKGEIDVTGAIICTTDLRKDLKFNIERIKQFAGVKQHIINTKVSVSNLLETMAKYPRAFYALSFSTPDNTLKIKAKAPKSGKPGKKGGQEEPKADFCSLKTSKKELVDELIFDFHDFKEIRIKHTLIIDSVILPQGVNDPVKIRELAKKKGKIIRYIKVDGRDETKEAEFEV
ncbi:MAG: hypothetical protein AABX83_01240 [Nanoarchaeota archaeon]